MFKEGDELGASVFTTLAAAVDDAVMLGFALALTLPAAVQGNEAWLLAALAMFDAEGKL